MKLSDEAQQAGLTSDLGEDFKETIPANKVKSLRQVYEGYEEWLPLFPAIFLKLPEREHHVDDGPVGS